MEGLRKTTGSFARCPGRYSIQAPSDYKSVRWNLINIRTKFVHRCTSFENSASENVCVVWIICKIVTCILSYASVRRLERKWKVPQNWVGVNVRIYYINPPGKKVLRAFLACLYQKNCFVRFSVQKPAVMLTVPMPRACTVMCCHVWTSLDLVDLSLKGHQVINFTN